MVKATAYYKGRSFVYCKIDSKHFVVDPQWSAYLKFRKEVPSKVELFSSLKLLRHKLFHQLGVLI